MRNIVKYHFSVNVMSLLSLAFCLLLFGCEHESYESGTGKYSGLHADFADVRTKQSETLISAVLDNGREVVFQQPLSYVWAEAPATTYRALLYYYETSTVDMVNPFMAQQVHVLPWKKASIGLANLLKDPIHVESYWISENGKYINLRIGLMIGKDDSDDSKLHRIGINHDSTTIRENGCHSYALSFLHSQNGVPEYYTTHQFISLPLNECSPGDEIVLTINTYDGMKQYTFDI